MAKNQADRSSNNAGEFVYVMCPFRISVGKPAILNRVFRGSFSRFRQRSE